MAITNLLNTIWYLKSALSLENKTFDIRYRCNYFTTSSYIGPIYRDDGTLNYAYQITKPFKIEDSDGLDIGTDGKTISFSGIYLNATDSISPTVYYEGKGFCDSKWRSMVITGGSDVTDPDLIEWLTQNASFSGYRISYDLSELELDEGIHQITVDHKIDRYYDSNRSMSVDYDNRQDTT